MGLKIKTIDRKSEYVVALLKTLLADEYVLSIRTREAYQYIHGSNFVELRKLFEAQYKSMDIIVVEVSHRVRDLGQNALATIENSIEATRLGQHNEKLKGQHPIIEALLDDHESMIRELTKVSLADEEIDISTAEFTAGLLRQHIEMSRALRKWL
ncbi:MAG TPA: ferritin-like domain-containing protein [Candidatus Acidoferrales bacterium]|nr:ferritin-like domain-containing protein [Candidatus Acidoferrales bacterium]